MPKPKSLLINAAVDIVQRAHDCQHVPSHRLHKGDKRLKVKKDRSTEYFCVACARETIERDIKLLNNLLKDLEVVEIPEERLF